MKVNKKSKVKKYFFTHFIVANSLPNIKEKRKKKTEKKKRERYFSKICFLKNEFVYCR